MLIGVIVCGLVEDYAINLVNSIEQISESNDVKCVVIPIKFLGLDYEKALNNKYGYCFNSSVAYSLLSCFDGLIIEMASVLMYADDEKKKQHAALFDKIPHVFISYDKEGSASVSLDNQAGLTEALEYMYKNGAKKFAMLGGTPNNVDAMARKACFEEFLAKHDLKYSDKSYQDGSFFLPCDNEADQLVADNMDADVFVCANDFLVRHIYKALRNHGIRPGSDVSVLGFDDSVICTSTYPAISSIRTDITEVGRASFNLLMDVIKNASSEHKIIPSKFILRDSICHKELDTEANEIHYEFEDFIKHNVSDININHLEHIRSNVCELLDLVDSRDKVDFNEIVDAIYKKLDDLFSLDGIDCLDWERFSDVINAKHTNWIKSLTNSDEQHRLTALFIKFYEYVMMVNNYVSPDKRYSEIAKNIGMESFLRETMQFVRNAEANYTRFISNVDFIGIKNAYLYLYDEPVYYMQGEQFEIPEYLNLKAALRDGEAISVAFNKQKIKRELIFDNEYVSWDGYSRLLLFPVYSDNILYGVLLCDMKRLGFESSDLFMNQIGSGIRMMNLRIENRQIVDDYEESVRRLKEYNITLDTMSKTDSLTGLNNRRGFYMRANTLLEFYPSEDKSLIVGYVDMNDLKLVNDRFGHDDGDYALKSIGSVITDYVTEYNGFAARIGGDEFAYIIVVPKESVSDNYREELYSMFDKFNQTTLKPYNVEVSVGESVIEKGVEKSLDDALHQADERLYYEKNVHKKISILKA